MSLIRVRMFACVRARARETGKYQPFEFIVKVSPLKAD